MWPQSHLAAQGAVVSEQRRARSGRRWLPWAAAGTALVVGGVIGGVIVAATQSSGSTASSNNSTASGATASSCQVTSVASQVVPSVVTIAASGANGSGTGSGEVIRPSGYILTNNHVISVAANGGSAHVLFSDGKTEMATLTGRDPLTDLAVLKIQPPSGMKVITLGSSSVHVGQPVVAVGAPLGLSGTVTSGIVSALDRTVEVPGENDSSALLVSALQTDAAINPGNSGGALVDCSGHLVGVPTAGASVPGASGGGSIGLGFAIPVDLAKSIADEIIATGRVTHAYFGLQTVPIPPEAAAQAGVSEGLYVQAVAAGGPAARAGLRADDIITKVGGKPATSNIQLQELSLTKKPGDTVAVEYTRNGHAAKATVTLAAQP
jgi:putative serine protease PepD